MTEAADSNTHWITAYLLHLDQQRNYSDRTLNAYRRDLNRFVAWLDSEACAATAQDVSRYVAQMKRQGLAHSSIQRNLSAIRSFYGFLFKQGAVGANPAAASRGPKHKRRLPKVLDTDQATQLLNFDAGSPQTLRDKALLELFYGSGLRLSEVAGLRHEMTPPAHSHKAICALRPPSRNQHLGKNQHRPISLILGSVGLRRAP